MSSFLIIVFILQILIVFIVLLLKTSAFEHNEGEIQAFPGTQSEFAKFDCNVETVYSVEDYQCNLKCKESGVFVSKNGTCVNILAFNQTKVDNECNPKAGVLAYLIGDPQFGNTKLICLSVDQGVQPDDPNKPNTICIDGSIDINYNESFPQIENCSCPVNEILITIPNTSTIRQRGICVNKKLKEIYLLNNSIYQKTV